MVNYMLDYVPDKKVLLDRKSRSSIRLSDVQDCLSDRTRRNVPQKGGHDRSVGEWRRYKEIAISVFPQDKEADKGLEARENSKTGAY